MHCKMYFYIIVFNAFESLSESGWLTNNFHIILHFKLLIILIRQLLCLGTSVLLCSRDNLRGKVFDNKFLFPFQSWVCSDY